MMQHSQFKIPALGASNQPLYSFPSSYSNICYKDSVEYLMSRILAFSAYVVAVTRGRPHKRRSHYSMRKAARFGTIKTLPCHKDTGHRPSL